MLAAILLVVLPLEGLWLLFLAFPEGAPENALLVSANADAASAVDWLQRVILITALTAMSALLARRWLRASAPLRRALAPVLAGAVAVGLLSATYLLDKVGVRAIVMDYLISSVLIAIPLVFLVGVLRARLARSAVGELLVDLREPADARRAARRARPRAARPVAGARLLGAGVPRLRRRRRHRRSSCRPTASASRRWSSAAAARSRR